MGNKDGNISTEILIEDLQRVGNIVRRPPKVKDITQYGDFSYSTYKNRFGGIVEALNQAGYNSSDRFKSGFVSRTDLIDNIKSVANSVSRTPRVVDLESYSEYQYSRYRSKFDHWYELLDEAGLERVFTSNQFPGGSDELLTNIQEVGDIIGGTPATSDLNEKGDYTSSVYVRNYESVSIAVALAGFNIKPEIPTRQISDGELLSSISEVTEYIGHPPTTIEYDEHGGHAIATISQRFGTWKNAVCTATGEVPNSNKTISDQELITDLKYISVQLIKSPQTQDIRDYSDYSYSTYIQHFDTWENILKMADIPASNNVEDTGAGAFVWHIIWLLNYIGDIPDKQEIKKHHPEMYERCCEEHGSWKSAVTEAQKLASEIIELFEQSAR